MAAAGSYDSAAEFDPVVQRFLCQVATRAARGWQSPPSSPLDEDGNANTPTARSDVLDGRVNLARASAVETHEAARPQGQRADGVVFRAELLLRVALVLRRAPLDLRVELRCVEADELVPLPFRPEVPLVLWRTMLRRSSGSSEARAFASSITSFAGRENASLFMSA